MNASAAMWRVVGIVFSRKMVGLMSCVLDVERDRSSAKPGFILNRQRSGNKNLDRILS